MFTRRQFVTTSAAGGVAVALGRFVPTASAQAKGRPVKLFNGKDFTGWAKFLDPAKGHLPMDQVFRVEDGVIHILDQEGFGYIATEREYENYHLSLEFKWGEKKWKPRADTVRDSGLLYHFPLSAEHKVWPLSVECQIQENDCGDFYLIAGAQVDVEVEKKGNQNVWKPGGEKITTKGRVVRSEPNEKPLGEWNQVEVIIEGQNCQHIINGKKNNAGSNMGYMKDGQFVPLTKGRIVLQSEGAEVYYRNVVLTPLK